MLLTIDSQHYLLKEALPRMPDLKGTIHSKVKMFFSLCCSKPARLHASLICVIYCVCWAVVYPSALLEILAKPGQLILDKARSSHAVSKLPEALFASQFFATIHSYTSRAQKGLFMMRAVSST